MSNVFHLVHKQKNYIFLYKIYKKYVEAIMICNTDRSGFRNDSSSKILIQYLNETRSVILQIDTTFGKYEYETSLILFMKKLSN